MTIKRGRNAPPPLLIVVVILVGCSLRLFGFDWGEGQMLHPDEVGITQTAIERVRWPAGTPIGALFDPAASPINPRTGGAAYPYGTLPLYLGKAAASVFTAGDYNSIVLSGRVLASLFDTGTLVLVFLIGSMLRGRWWGLLSATFYALGVLPIQQSHFYISEPFMTFFMTAVLFFSLLFYWSGRVAMLIIAGVCAGLAMSCKLSAAPVLVLPLAALLLREYSRPAHARSDSKKIAGIGALTFMGAFAGLFVGDPYGVLDVPTYLRQVADQAAIQSGAADVWFTRRYVGTWPVIYPWSQLVLLGIGPLVGLCGTLGAGIATVRLWTRREWSYGLLLAVSLVYFASIAFLEAKWVRYLLPLVPYLCLFATLCLVWLWDLGSDRRYRWLFAAASRLLLASAVVGAVAFSSIYWREHTMVQASQWIYSDVVPGGKIGDEINDGVLPLPLQGHSQPEKEYSISRLRMLADFPSEEASTYLREGLRGIDYLVVGSTRAARTVPVMPWRYPVQERYYDLLFGGSLGFSPVYTASSYPSLLGASLPDDVSWIDASFTEYDHPTFRIFKKNRDLSDAEWDALFADAARKTAVATRRAP